ncbi:MAG: PDZ domain-containing protein [Cyanobacteria bacterium SZAS LIN-3]|nr:PDZ domain-containing protein [Cyanobacteria bacterium SZAS LIN-3]MBS2010734.1 PDZ domain-containing protein [Cyanobacteria bacterium SZAS TMP-1]
MNIMTKLRKGLAGARNVVLSALFATALVAPLALPAYAQTNAAPAAATATTAPVAVPFDGKAVYKTAFEYLRDNHYTLVTPAARAAFTAKWEHKHDNDTALTTEKGTDIAVYEMMWSLGQRFDYYFPPAQTKAERQEVDATMGGIGLSLKEEGLAKAIKALGPKPTNEQVEPLLKMSDERPLVAAETPDGDTPAGKANIVKGDRIIAVDGVSVNGKTTDEVVSKIRGTAGSKVTLTIAHTGADGKVTTRPVVLTRAVITLHVVKTDYQGRIAHIRLSNFMSQFGLREMGMALQTAAQKNASGIVLDLRGNPGGDLGQVLQMASMFIDTGVILQQVERDGDHMVTITFSVTHDKFVVSQQSDDGSPAVTKEYDRIPVLIPATTPVIVLIDEGSASASEILSGTLQANHRAVVMGQPSHGKGVGQVVKQLPAERSMHITTFEFLPGGVKMDWVGVVPDIEVTMPADADPMDDPTTDAQLNAAKLELINIAIGNPTPARTQAQVDARRAELEKAHRGDFAKEVQYREEALKKAAEAAAKGADATNATINPPTKPTAPAPQK